MFVLQPDPFLLPSYGISPFQTKDISLNSQLPISDLANDYFKKRFNKRPFFYVKNGREAINIALQHYNLHTNDVVTILTSSGNFYISSCVTNEVEKFCTWSRKIEHNTKVIFVNHEFGYPYPQIETLKKYNLPIIEDCCHSFFSTNNSETIGTTGDFSIYSFPKIFPIQIGGLLTTNKLTNLTHTIADNTLQYIKNVLSFYLPQQKDIVAKRIENYQYLAKALHTNTFNERFTLLPGIVPGVFMFTVKDNAIQLPALKTYLYAHGIQCSVFYGEHAFFIPVHQQLSKIDLDYFIAVIHSMPIIA
jgi:DegT/DnrJ/EryC1/StrS aminotransferase family